MRWMTVMMIVLAATAALAQDEPVELPLANPGFEEDGGWAMRPAELISFDGSVARTGQRSLRIAGIVCGIRHGLAYLRGLV